jgi:hypothetical protein
LGVTSGIISQVVNNVAYNWQNRVGSTKGAAKTDFYGNYWKKGSMSADNVILHEHLEGGSGGTPLPDPSLYIAESIASPDFMTPSANNWPLITFNYTGDGYTSGDVIDTQWKREAMHTGSDAPTFNATLLTAQQTYNSLITDQDVGCNGRVDENGNFVANMDSIDTAIINHIINGTGPTTEAAMDHEDDFGGYPSVDTGTAYTDSDADGMADTWETAQGLNTSLDDSALFTLDNNYTNIEVFVNLSDTTITPPHTITGLTCSGCAN